MSLIEKIINLKKKPLPLILMAISDRIPFRIAEVFFYHSYLLDPCEIKASCGGVEVIEAQKEDLDKIVVDNSKKTLFYKRFVSNETCLVALKEGKVAGYEWFTTTGHHIEERYGIELDIPDNALYAYDAYVYEDYRGQGIWKCIMVRAKETMSRYRKKGIAVYIDYGNNVSELAHKKQGFRKQYLYIYVKLLAWRHLFKIDRRDMA